jgi:hypothetical protein
MRASILAWSAFSGLVLGLFCGVALLAAVLAGLELVAPGAARALERWRPALLALCLVVIPLVGALLGYLEGRLKLS